MGRIYAINIKEATRLAMKRAVDGLAPAPDHLLVDWRQVPDVTMTQTILVRGDSRSLSIAAASIIAKVTRDRIMYQHHRTYPAYNFKSHKGYGTKEHMQAIKDFGVTKIHRRTFAPIRELIDEEN